MCKQRTARRVNVNLGEKEKKSNRPWCAYILGSPYVEDRASIIDEIFTIDYTWYTGDRKNYVFEFLKLTDYPPFHFLSIIIEISLSLSLSSLRKENRIYFCEQVYASRDNMSGSSSCERNRAFYEVSVSENEARYYICKGTARNFRVGRVKAPFESLFLPLPPYRPLYHDPVFLRIRDTKGRERRRWKIKGGRKKREGGKKKMRGKSASR